MKTNILKYDPYAIVLFFLNRSKNTCAKLLNRNKQTELVYFKRKYID